MKFTAILALAATAFAAINATPEEVCNDESLTEKKCAALEGCVWCISHAVPSRCLTLEQAEGLPSSVFDCKFKKFSLDADAEERMTYP